MKKSIKYLLSSLTTLPTGELIGGFIHIKGGFKRTAYPVTNTKVTGDPCTNSDCGPNVTNSPLCSNSVYCNTLNSGTCTNSAICQ